MTEFLNWLESTSFCTWIRDSGSIWAYPLVLTLHTTGMGVLVGFNWALDLRLLGIGRKIPVGPLEKFFSVMWIGFWVNLLTGIVLLAADATTKLTSWVFGVKMLFIVLAMIVLVRLKKTVFPSETLITNEDDRNVLSNNKTKLMGDGSVAVLEEVKPIIAVETISNNAKTLAALSLLFWTLSITFGRLMAYLGPQTGISAK